MNESDRHEPILRTEGLTKRFGEFAAVENVDLTFDSGELRGLIGPNGAGKTTLFYLLSGLLSPTAGRVVLDGEDVTGFSPDRIARRGMTVAFQITSIFPGLTVVENVVGGLNGQRRVLDPFGRYDSPEARAEAVTVLERVGLADQADRTAGDLAHGDQRALELALALAGDPDVLLLDEPTAGLSRPETREMVALIETLADETTVVLVEHDVDLVMGLVDSLTVVHDGEIIAEGSPDEIRENRTVENVYLGRQE